MSFYLSADLGQVNDYTAISVVESVSVPTGKTWVEDLGGGAAVERTGAVKNYHLRHLRRYLGEPYTVIADKIEQAVARLESPTVIVDATGVGRPVVDMIRDRGISVVSITITGGDAVNSDGSDYRVPKRDLVGTMQILLQNKQLKIAKHIPLKDKLVSEMQTFKMKLSKDGHDTYEHWRDSDHDDLVLSVAMALWYANEGAISWLLS